MQVAAVNPQYVDRESVDAAEVSREMDIYRDQARAMGKPEKMLDKIAEGKLEKYYAEVCLVDQPFVKDDKRKVQERIQDTVAKTGEKISIKRFARFQIGEES